MQPRYFIGIDGGATGTRAILAGAEGPCLGRGEAGPSSLTLGVATAWQSINAAVTAALRSAGLAEVGECRATAALAGTRNPERRAAFLADPAALMPVELVTDGYAALVGAHGGKPGVVVAVGTGVVAHVLYEDGTSGQAGGWGFPVEDVGSGAWLGMMAIRASLHVLDGIEGAPDAASRLHRAILETCGPSHEDLIAWTVGAPSTKYAGLAPLVVTHAEAGDSSARALMAGAADAVAHLARAAGRGALLPLALSGSLARPLEPYLPDDVRRRLVPPAGAPVDGALMLARGLAPPERVHV